MSGLAFTYGRLLPNEIAVVGSLNHDLTVVAPRLPRPGETILGTNHYSDNGGKGANQAVAAARLGGRVSMFGLVGDDPHGHQLIDQLRAEGIDVSGVAVDTRLRTGLAVITVDETAENTIVVSPGANAGLGIAHIEPHETFIADARVLLVQLEVPNVAVVSAARACRGIVCLNPAPAQALTLDLLAHVDVLTPNRNELLSLSGVEIAETRDQLLDAIERLEFEGAVVVTLGSDGALVVEGGVASPVEAPVVAAVDPTGAGDAFCGALGFALSQDRPLLEAARWAVAAGAIAATRRGAQASMPTASEVEDLLRG